MSSSSIRVRELGEPYREAILLRFFEGLPPRRIAARLNHPNIVGVFDTTTGKLVLVRNAHPMVSAGQNFALSANGRRFAILRNQAIEIYNLPANSNAPPTAAIASK